MRAFAEILDLPTGSLRFVDLRAAAGGTLARVPWCLRVLLENALRTCEPEAALGARDAIVRHAGAGAEVEIPFRPRRILMHDTTCGPALVDIAAMRDVIAEHGGDPAALSPICPVATSTDHSVGVDRFAQAGALADNMRIEIGRNAERYRFMKWAAGNLGNFRVFPPGTGIMHTINLEHLTPVVAFETIDGEPWVLPDTLLGTDSHTPMINAVGVLGWGVGGLEAEGAMFGLPLALRLPEVVGVRLTGRLRPGVLGTDVALSSILGGHVTVGISGYGEFGPQVDAGTLRALAVSSEERLPGVDIPTLKEQGLDVAFFNWRGLFAPPDIRDADLEALQAAITGMVESQAWKDTVKERQWTDLYQPATEFAAFLKEDRVVMEGILTDLGLAK